MKKIIIVRHGQSIWNLENKFTGWTDVELSKKGIEEAKKAGKLLKELNYNFDIAYTSTLKRANDTLYYILKELNNKDIPIYYTYKLNERHYGALQGLNKDDMREKYGNQQVQLWRRSINVKPPALTKDDPRYPGNNPKYKNINKEELPLSESLLDTIKRVKEYWTNEILPQIKNNKKIIIVAHGNSIRALISFIENLKEQETINLEIDTGRPICYEFDDNTNPIKYYYIDKNQKNT